MGGVFLYTGDTGSGKSSKALADLALDLVAEPNRSYVVIDLERAAIFRKYPHEQNVDQVLEKLYGPVPGRAFWTPRGVPENLEEFDELMRSTLGMGGVTVVIDGVRWVASARSISGDLTRALLGWRQGEEGLATYRCVTQRVNLHADFYATHPVHYIHHTGVLQDLDDLETRYGLARADVLALELAEKTGRAGDFIERTA